MARESFGTPGKGESCEYDMLVVVSRWVGGRICQVKVSCGADKLGENGWWEKYFLWRWVAKNLVKFSLSLLVAFCSRFDFLLYLQKTNILNDENSPQAAKIVSILLPIKGPLCFSSVSAPFPRLLFSTGECSFLPQAVSQLWLFFSMAQTVCVAHCLVRSKVIEWMSRRNRTGTEALPSKYWENSGEADAAGKIHADRLH